MNKFNVLALSLAALVNLVFGSSDAEQCELLMFLGITTDMEAECRDVFSQLYNGDLVMVTTTTVTSTSYSAVDYATTTTSTITETSEDLSIALTTISTVVDTTIVSIDNDITATTTNYVATASTETLVVTDVIASTTTYVTNKKRDENTGATNPFTASGTDNIVVIPTKSLSRGATGVFVSQSYTDMPGLIINDQVSFVTAMPSILSDIADYSFVQVATEIGEFLEDIYTALQIKASYTMPRESFCTCLASAHVGFTDDIHTLTVTVSTVINVVPTSSVTSSSVAITTTTTTLSATSTSTSSITEEDTYTYNEASASYVTMDATATITTKITTTTTETTYTSTLSPDDAIQNPNFVYLDFWTTYSSNNDVHIETGTANDLTCLPVNDWENCIEVSSVSNIAGSHAYVAQNVSVTANLPYQFSYPFYISIGVIQMNITISNSDIDTIVITENEYSTDQYHEPTVYFTPNKDWVVLEMFIFPDGTYGYGEGSSVIMSGLDMSFTDGYASGQA